uniref:Uncharacterized protein n=1 Tax=Rhizophora mucronata TaxID=61149 RepID=A0A2P2NJX8_RHIMU
MIPRVASLVVVLAGLFVPTATVQVLTLKKHISY